MKQTLTEWLAENKKICEAAPKKPHERTNQRMWAFADVARFSLPQALAIIEAWHGYAGFSDRHTRVFVQLAENIINREQG